MIASTENTFGLDELKDEPREPLPALDPLQQAAPTRSPITRCSVLLVSRSVPGAPRTRASCPPRQAHEDGRTDQVEQLNHEFHRALNTAAESPRLAYVLRTFTLYAPRLFFAEIDGWSQASASDHRAIIAGLRAGDADQAADAMAEHVLRGTLLADHVDRQQGRST